MKKGLIAILLSLALCLGLMPAAAFAADAPSASFSEQAWEVLRLVNQHRMSIGAQPLSAFDGIQQVANLRAAECVELFSHDRPDGRSWSSAYAEYGFGYSSAAENIAMGYGSAASVMNGWLNSDGHRHNIENTGLTHLGIGQAGSTWSQNFVSSSRCSHSGLQLSQTSVSGAKGESLDDILLRGDVTVSFHCSEYGACRMPLIAAMCSGYNLAADGAQTITISCNGSTAELTVYRTPTVFTDLSPTGYYLTPVAWAVENAITTGKTDTTFAPDENCTHGQILTFLWRAAGEPESDAAAPIDMKGDEFYFGAVKWAAEQGMIDAKFDPYAPCTRAYAVLYIWQAFGSPAPSGSTPFTDVPAYAASAPAVAWALENGVTTGATATTFNPGGICNRGQIVTFLYRAYN